MMADLIRYQMFRLCNILCVCALSYLCTGLVSLCGAVMPLGGAPGSGPGAGRRGCGWLASGGRGGVGRCWGGI